MFKQCPSKLICDGGEEKQEKEEKGEDLGSVILEGKVEPILSKASKEAG